MKIACIIAVAAVLIVPMEFEIDMGSSSLDNGYCTVTYEDYTLTYWDTDSSEGRIRLVFDYPLDTITLTGDSTYIADIEQKGYSYVAIFDSVPAGEYEVDYEPNMIRIDPIGKEYMGIWMDY